jgi:hypothetical protein
MLAARVLHYILRPLLLHSMLHVREYSDHSRRHHRRTPVARTIDVHFEHIQAEANTVVIYKN